MKYYLNKDTGVVHLRADFPQPRSTIFTHCGRSILLMDKVKKPTGRTKVRLCQRCVQLTAADFDE